MYMYDKHQPPPLPPRIVPIPSRREEVLVPEQSRKDGQTLLMASLRLLHQVVDGNLSQHALTVQHMRPQ
jgi:hypothetical protein